LVRQDIKIKHHDELIESYSYDPFKESPELLKMAFDAHDISITKVKRQDRMENQSQQKKIITTSVGPAQLLDISSRNITILLPTALFKGSKIELNLDTLSDDQRLILEKNNIGTILSEVVWSYEEQEGSIHEIRILDLTEAQKQLLVDILSQSLIFDAKEKAG
jgi:hypothetical protein